MTDNKENTYLVIRASDMDGYHIINELEQVIDSIGFVWFGKYGRAISYKNFTTNIYQRNLVLVRRDKTSYTFREYIISEHSRLRPDPSQYPEYYKNYLRRISTWIKLNRPESQTIKNIDDLVIKSSSGSLIEALRHSTSSHFLCLRRISN